MEVNFLNIILCIAIGSGIFFRMYKITSFAFPKNLLVCGLFLWALLPNDSSLKEIANFVNNIYQLLVALKHNANPKLALEVLMLSIPNRKLVTQASQSPME